MTRAALTVPIRVALQAAGFADRELRVYTSQRSWLPPHRAQPRQQPS